MSLDRWNQRATRELEAEVVDGEPFQREERYIVIKRKHLAPLYEKAIRDFLKARDIPIVECAVIESDWPEYETVWKMIKDRVTGSQSEAATVDGGEEFNRGVLIAVSTLINCWGESTETEHLLRMINADPEMIERMDFEDYDREPLLKAVQQKGPEDE